MAYNKKLILVIIGVIFVAAIAAYFIMPDKFNMAVGGSVPMSAFGFTTLSISQAQFTSSNSFFQGQVYILSVAQGGMGQTASGTISPTDIKNAGSSQQPTDGFTININYQTQQCEYPITPNYQATPIYSYDYKTWGYDINPLHLGCQEDTAKQICPNNRIAYGKFGASWTCVCVMENPIISTISYNSIQNPYVHTVSQISVSGGKNGAVNGQLTVDTKNTIQGYVGSNVYAVWNGYLVQNVCPTNANQYVGYFNQGKWQLGSSASYTNYLNVRNANYQNLLAPGGTTEDNFKFWVNNVNSAEQQALQAATFGDGIINPTSTSSAIIYQTMNSQIQVPIYTLYVKADALGIYQPVPDIQIKSLNFPQFKTQGTIAVMLYNAGDKAGNANVYAKCSSPAQDSNTITMGVASKESQVAYLEVSGSVQTKTTVTCTVYVVNSAGKTYSQQISTVESPEVVCVPNQYICDVGNVVKRCNADGSGYDTIKQCGSNEVCAFEGSVSTCKSTGEGGSGGGVTVPPFDYTLIAYATVIILVIVFVALAWRERKKPRSRKRI